MIFKNSTAFVRFCDGKQSRLHTRCLMFKHSGGPFVIYYGRRKLLRRGWDSNPRVQSTMDQQSIALTTRPPRLYATVHLLRCNFLEVFVRAVCEARTKFECQMLHETLIVKYASVLKKTGIYIYIYIYIRGHICPSLHQTMQTGTNVSLHYKVCKLGSYVPIFMFSNF